MCNQCTLHIINSGLTAGGQNLSKRQTVFFTSVDPMNKEHRDPDIFDLEAPRLSWYKQKTWKKHQDTVYWVDIKLAQKEGLEFYQTRSNAIILYNTLPGYCIPKAIKMETGEIKNQKVYVSPRPPPKISSKDNKRSKCCAISRCKCCAISRCAKQVLCDLSVRRTVCVHGMCRCS